MIERYAFKHLEYLNNSSHHQFYMSDIAQKTKGDTFPEKYCDTIIENYLAEEDSIQRAIEIEITKHTNQLKIYQGSILKFQLEKFRI